MILPALSDKIPGGKAHSALLLQDPQPDGTAFLFGQWGDKNSVDAQAITLENRIQEQSLDGSPMIIGDLLLGFINAQNSGSVAAALSADGWTSEGYVLYGTGATGHTGVAAESRLFMGWKWVTAEDIAGDGWTFNVTTPASPLQAIIACVRYANNHPFNDFSLARTWNSMTHPQANVGDLFGDPAKARNVLTVSAANGGWVHSFGPPATPVYFQGWFETDPSPLGSMQLAQLTYDASQVATTNVPIGHDQVAMGVQPADSAILTLPLNPRTL